MLALTEMTYDQLEDLLQRCFHSMDTLIVGNKIPTENRRVYQDYQELVTAIDEAQAKWCRAHPTVAGQDTTHSIW